MTSSSRVVIHPSSEDSFMRLSLRLAAPAYQPQFATTACPVCYTEKAIEIFPLSQGE
jgi:hypothetical protein